MIGLLVTFFVVAYLLVPSGLFRSFYSLFLPRIIKSQRSRTEEFTFAVLASILPFLLALALVWTVATQPFGIQGKSSTDRREAYRTVIGAALSDKGLGQGAQIQIFWAATNQVIRRQTRFLFWYYLLVLGEAWIYTWSTRNYGLWSTNLTGVRWRRRLYQWTAKKILLPAVSEWHVLLTPFSSPPKPAREVWVDVLTTIDILYQGGVADFFLDKDGKLSGIFLECPRRFDRKQFLKDIEQKRANSDTDFYWKNIPSKNLYIPNDKIINLNVRYLTQEQGTALRASWLLAEEGLDVEADS